MMLNAAPQTNAPPLTNAACADLPALEIGETVIFEIPAIEQAVAETAEAPRDDEEIAQSLYNLAVAQFERKNYSQAESLLASTLPIVQRVYGGNHLAVAEILSNMAVIRLAGNDFDSAERLLHRAILIVEELNGAEIELARAFNNLGAVYHRQGNFDDAEQCFREALAIMERTLLEETGSAEHPEMLPILHNYAALLQGTIGRQDVAPFARMDKN